MTDSAVPEASGMVVRDPNPLTFNYEQMVALMTLTIEQKIAFANLSPTQRRALATLTDDQMSALAIVLLSGGAA